MFSLIGSLHDKVFGGIQRGFENWFLGLFARLVFAAVLFMYFFNSAKTKIGEGALGFLTITDNAYFQILPSVVEQYGFDVSQVPTFPYKLIVMAGTYGEIILPILIVIGLLTRIAAIGMIAFVLVQSYVDIAFHAADETTIGAWFDRLSDSVILDQRALWVFLFVYLVIRGAGAISLDYLFYGRKAANHSTRYASMVA